MKMKLSVLSLLAATAWVVSCKSTSSHRTPGEEQALGQEQGLTKYEDCANGRSPQSNPTITVDCHQFTSGHKICGKPNRPVTFTTTCDNPVTISFTLQTRPTADGGTETLYPFTDNTGSVTVPGEDGGSVVKTLNSSGNFPMFISTDAGTPPVRNESSTGSLDVATSGGGEDEEKNLQP